MPARKEPQQNAEDTAKTRPKRRRKWLRRLVWLVVLGALALLINGPVFRWALNKFPKDILRDNGLTAEYTVDGSLLGPWELHDIAIADPETGTDISVSEIFISLDWWNTIRREIAQPVDHLRISDAIVALDLRPKPMTKEERAAQQAEDEANEANSSTSNSPPVDKLRSVFATMTKFIGHTTIDIDLQELRVIANDDMTWQIDDTSIAHQPGSAIKLNIGSTILPDNKIIRDADLTINYLDESINIRNIAARDDLVVEHANLAIVDDSLTVVLLASLFGADINIQSPDLNVVALQITSGALSVPAALDFVEDITGVNVRIPSGSITKLNANMTLDGAAWPEGINGDIDMAVDDLITYGMTIGDAKILINKTGPTITLRELDVNTPGARVQLTNAVTDATQFTTPRFWSQIPAESIRIDMRDLHDTLKAYRVDLGDKFPKVRGTVTGSTSPAPSTTAMMPAAQLTAKIEPIDPKAALSAAFQINTDGNFASPIDIELAVSQGKNTSPIVKSNSQFTIDTLGYTTDTKLALEQAETLDTILRWLGNDAIGEVTTQLRIESEGIVNKLNTHKGSLVIDSLELTRDDLFPIDASANITYENSRISANSIKAHVEGFSIDLAGNYDRERVEIRDLTVKHQDGKAALLASASLPLDEKSITTPLAVITGSSPLMLNLDFQSPNLAEIAPLLSLAGLSPDKLGLKSGPIKINAQAERTAETPLGFSITADATKILLASDPNQAPIDIDFNANSDNNAHLDAAVTYGKIGKLLAHGEMGWQPKRWANDLDALFEESFTIDAIVDKMPVDFIKNLTDFIPEIDGHLTLEAKGSGKIREPEITGAATLVIGNAIFNTPYFPGVKDLRFAIALDGDQIDITEGTFDSAGGDYIIDGTIGVSDLRDPLFDITVACKQGLVFRNNAITARANADLAFKGPLSDALLSGTVDLIQTLYYREIRILSPSSTLGVSSGPALPKFEQSVENAQQAIEATPGILKNIKLDVQINSKDPIRIRSNLAQADIAVDIHAKNNLSDPHLDGKATILNGEAQLPLSSLRIVSGSATFSPERGFIPTLNIQAQSKPGRYKVNIYISGPADSPKVIMSSNPPLPQSEIYSLLATGSTREDLAGGGTAALKAAMLLTRELSASNNSFPLKAVSKAFDLVSELNVSIGETDQLTGKKSHSARVSLTDRFAVRVEYDEADTRAALIYEIPLK